MYSDFPPAPVETIGKRYRYATRIQDQRGLAPETINVFTWSNAGVVTAVHERNTVDIAWEDSSGSGCVSLDDLIPAL